MEKDHWFTFQLPATAEARQEPWQKLRELTPGVAYLWQGPNDWKHYFCLISRKLDSVARPSLFVFNYKVY